jgi:GNAT superfamily N-acetyltransferase
MTDEKPRIRWAGAGDAPLIAGFLCELAAHDGEAAICRMTAADVRHWGFGIDSRFEILIVMFGEEPVGMTLFCPIFSTWDANPGLFVDDFYVAAQARDKGVDRHLFAAVAAPALERGCGRFEWNVLHRVDAVTFYEAMGGRKVEKFATYRPAGEPLQEIVRYAAEPEAGPQEGGRR